MSAKQEPHPGLAKVDAKARELAKAMFAAAQPPDPRRRIVKRLRPRKPAA